MIAKKATGRARDQGRKRNRGGCDLVKGITYNWPLGRGGGEQSKGRLLFLFGEGIGEQWWKL